MGHKDKIFSKVGFLEIVISFCFDVEMKKVKEGAIQTILNIDPYFELYETECMSKC